MTGPSLTRRVVMTGPSLTRRVVMIDPSLTRRVVMTDPSLTRRVVMIGPSLTRRVVMTDPSLTRRVVITSGREVNDVLMKTHTSDFTKTRIMKTFSFIAVCMFVSCLAVPSFAQDSTALSEKAVRKKANVGQVSEARKQELLSFVNEHHPELKDLLAELENGKKARPYRRAMGALDRSVKKIESTKQRNPKRYEMALRQWKLESRIKVAAAQVKLNDSEENRSELETLVAKLVDFHVERMKSERDQIKKRLGLIEKRIADIEANRAEAIEKRIKSATRTRKKEKKKD